MKNIQEYFKNLLEIMFVYSYYHHTNCYFAFSLPREKRKFYMAGDLPFNDSATPSFPCILLELPNASYTIKT